VTTHDQAVLCSTHTSHNTCKLSRSFHYSAERDPKQSTTFI